MQAAGYGWSPPPVHCIQNSCFGPAQIVAPEIALKIPNIAAQNAFEYFHDLTERSHVSAGVGPLRVGVDTCRFYNFEADPA